MDPLSVGASIAGLLSAAGAVAKALSPFVAAARDTPKIAAQVSAEVNEATIILSALNGLAQNMASVSVQRAALVSIDQIVAVLTDGVLVFSDLEATVGLLPLGASNVGVWLRLQWARKEPEFVALLSRLQGFKSSISLILNILQSDSALRAERFQSELADNYWKLLESNKDIASRLICREDAFTVQTPVSNRPSEDSTGSSPPTTSIPPRSQLMVPGFDFQGDLEASRPYRRANRDSVDFSFRSSMAKSHAWSILDELSLSDASNMSVIALPIYADEITNPSHYEFGGQPPELPSTRVVAAPEFASGSFLRDCLEVELKLSQIDIFRELFEGERGTEVQHPFWVLRRVFQKGYPLMMLFNIWEPRFDLPAFHDSSRVLVRYKRSVAKEAIYRAISAFSSVPEFRRFNLTVKAVLDPDGDITGFLEVFGVIRLVLTVKNEQFQPVDVDAAISQMRKDNQDPSLAEPILEFIHRERAFIDRIQEIPAIERRLLEYNALTGDEMFILFTPLQRILKTELEFLLRAEMNLLRSPQEERWRDAFHEWFPVAQIYGTLIGSEARNRKLLRGKLIGNSETESSSQRDAIFACLELLSLPLLSIRSKVNFMQALPHPGLDLDEKQLEDSIQSKALLQKAQDEIARIVESEKLHDVGSDIKARMAGWRGLRPETFGDLLFYEPAVTAAYTIYRNDSPKDAKIGLQYHRYRAYLFEEVLILAKQIHSQISTGNRLLRKAKHEPSNHSTRLNDPILLGHDYMEVISIDNAILSDQLLRWSATDPKAELPTITEMRFASPTILPMWAAKLREAVGRKTGQCEAAELCCELLPQTPKRTHPVQ